MRKRGHRAALLLASATVCSSARAGEEIAYRYDSLGRLVRVERSGTVNHGANTAYGYDAADNRTNVTAGPPAPIPPPAPPPAPPPPNRSPTPMPDSFSIARCVAGSFDVIANDSDPDGHYPLALAEISGPAAIAGYAAVASSTRIAWAKAARPGDYALGYVVRDARGAAASMQLMVTVTGTGTSPC